MTNCHSFVYFLTLASIILSALASSTYPVIQMQETKTGCSTKDVRIVFSDVDGTLVHYNDIPPPKTTSLDDTNGKSLSTDENKDLIHLPSSSTGMKGVISVDTLRKCQELRQRGIKLVLISGMRSPTLWKRIPYLPKADAYCCEAGGRIFYPRTIKSTDNTGRTFQLQSFDGIKSADQQPFALVEDIEWKGRMEASAGFDGYAGNEIREEDPTNMFIPVSQRKGLLWEFCNELQQKGLVVDTVGYSVCFRLNRSQQVRQFKENFDNLYSMHIPDQLTTSVNLGCIDVYPKESGKKNCCQYVMTQLCPEGTTLQNSAVCLCDDDNDLEMALACHHAFLPGISSQSMRRVIDQNPNHMTVTGGIDDLEGGTKASELALNAILTMVSPS